MIYLDNAATTFPKPDSVYKEVDLFCRSSLGNPGRGSHRFSRLSDREIFACREAIAELLGASSENVVFTLNATYALNIAIKSLYRSGGEVLISNIEHNSVLRTVSSLGCKYSFFSADGNEDQIIASFLHSLSPRTSLVVCNHLSNICGIIMPIEKIGEICSKLGIPFIVDISQSAGVKKIDIKKCRADVICAPGHKGLYGLQGCGFAVFSDKYRDMPKILSEFVFGGSGVNSLDINMPEFLPEKFEAGTLSTPAIIGLRKGIEEISKIGIETVDGWESDLADKLKNMLANISGVEIYAGNYRGGTVLFNINGMPSERAAEQLDIGGFCVRSGFHCCPLAHKFLKTGDNGAIRASFSIFNKLKDVHLFASFVSKMVKNRD